MVGFFLVLEDLCFDLVKIALSKDDTFVNLLQVAFDICIALRSSVFEDLPQFVVILTNALLFLR